jgi:hypothetical protein
VHYIHVDESGTGGEPVCVVAGIIDANQDERERADKMMAEALDMVPARFRQDFVFHAYEVLDFPKERRLHWPLADRLAFLYRVMSIPRILRLPVVYAYHRDIGTPPMPFGSYTEIQRVHLQTFVNCLAVADKFIRDHTPAGEQATVIAEDVEPMRRSLAASLEVRRVNPVAVKGSRFVMGSGGDTIEERAEREVKIDRIVNNYYFIKKNETGTLVRVADACAFGLRRFYSRLAAGDDFAMAICGTEEIVAHFRRPSDEWVSGWMTWLQP